LFFLYGCNSDGNPLAMLFLFLGTIAIASANFLILELTHPYQGIFKVSSAAFELLLASMIPEQGQSAEPDSVVQISSLNRPATVF
jgi:hypothetical protein